MEEITILIVDDNPTNIRVLFSYLAELGFKTLAAFNGERAIQQAELVRPDLILLDVMMPGFDGFETCRRLKENEHTQEIPIIFVTALDDIASKVKGFEVGGVDYITKPFQHQEVLARVTTHLTICNLQRTLQTNMRELQARNEELDAFAHTVAHDLKNPLNIIIGFTELLEEEATSISVEELQKHTGIIAKNGRKMSSIIDSLLLLSTVRKQEIELEPVDMDSIVFEARKRLADMIQESQAEIIVPNSWPDALGYSPWVEEVWVNYISNALKYGGESPVIELGAGHITTILAGEKWKKNNKIYFWVRDNGPGLTLDEQSRLFTPFVRLNQVRVEGHGLGLSIVQRIMDRIGGLAGVESETGKGSLFYFTLNELNEANATDS